ncbi:MAG: hypothetical protein RIQ89_555 [Bacteroidota bacterium]|jgi:hypothetical protein
MKKNFILSLFAVILGTPIWAQITISSADLPQSGDTIRSSIGTAFAGMDPSLTGANYNWDYSQLGLINQTVDTFVDESVTNPLFAAVFINVGFNTNRANQATAGPSFTLGGVNVDDVFNFYFNGNTEYRQPGLGATVNQIPLPIIFDQHDIIYHLPIVYNASDSSNSSYGIDLTSTLGVYYGSTTKRVNNVDGWGSLTTPLGTFNALRVKTVLTGRDSVFIDSLGFGFGINRPANIEYKWLGIGQKLPLLQINMSQNVVTQIKYRDIYRTPNGQTKLEDANSPQFNYASFNNKLSWDGPILEHIAIYNLTGQKVYEQNGLLINSITINQDFKDGIYLIQYLDTKNQLGAQKITLY